MRISDWSSDVCSSDLAWQAYVDAGWSTLDHPVEHGGQGLPLFLAASVQQLVDSSCAAFGMLPVLQRSAARLLASFGREPMKGEWLQIGRASCRERVCQYVEFSVVAVSLKKKKQ